MFHHNILPLRLWGWPKLKSLPQQVQHLTSLTELSIHSFKGVETSPEWLGNLTSLVELNIYNCEVSSTCLRSRQCSASPNYRHWVFMTVHFCMKDAPRTVAKNGPRFLTFPISKFHEDLKPRDASVKCPCFDRHGFHISRDRCTIGIVRGFQEFLCFAYHFSSHFSESRVCIEVLHQINMPAQLDVYGSKARRYMRLRSI